MTNTVLRWVVSLVALLVLGPIAGWLTASLRAPDGGADATILLCNTPVWGVIAGILAMALAGAAGIVASRLLNAYFGFFAAGLVLAWAAWGTGTIDQILRRTQSAGTLRVLAVESLILGVLATVIAVLIVSAARTRDTAVHGELDPIEGAAGGWITGEHALGFLAALVGGGAAAYFIAVEALKGQTFAAAVLAGLAAAVVGRLTAQRAPGLIFFGAIVLLAIVSPVAVSMLQAGGRGVTAAAYASSLIPLARPLPLDWLAGAFVGIPLGLSWAASMLEKPAAAQA